MFIGALATTIEHPAVRHAMVLGKGESVAFELDIPVGAAVAGRSVSGIAADPAFPRSCVFAAIYGADGGVEAPRGSTVVIGGMTVLLVATRSALGEVVEFFLRRAP